jgi:hypothetical protein
MQLRKVLHSRRAPNQAARPCKPAGVEATVPRKLSLYAFGLTHQAQETIALP